MTDTRLRNLLILAAASLAIAAGCFFLGGLVAEATSAGLILGVSFKAGGSLAGFVISFQLLLHAYQTFGGASLVLKIAVRPETGSFRRSGQGFSANVTVLKHASMSKSDRDAMVVWEAGSLTVHVRNIEQDDLVMIALSDGASRKWESEYFSPLCPSISLK